MRAVADYLGVDAVSPRPFTSTSVEELDVKADSHEESRNDADVLRQFVDLPVKSPDTPPRSTYAAPSTGDNFQVHTPSREEREAMSRSKQFFATADIQEQLTL